MGKPRAFQLQITIDFKAQDAMGVADFREQVNSHFRASPIVALPTLIDFEIDDVDLILEQEWPDDVEP